MSPPLDMPAGEHRWAAETLPWLVNGSLGERETLRLRAHLQQCAECRRDFDLEQDLARRLGAAPVVDYAPQASLSRMLRRLDAASERRPWWQVLRSGRSERSPLVLMFAVQAAALVLLSVAVTWLAFRREPPALYQTLSQAPAPVAAQLQVLFADHATTAEVRATLARVGGHIVDGPTRAGVFLVALEMDPEAARQVLQAEPDVRYVAVLPPAPPAAPP